MIFARRVNVCAQGAVGGLILAVGPLAEPYETAVLKQDYSMGESKVPVSLHQKTLQSIALHHIVHTALT